MTSLLLFGSTFAVVFALGLQSLNVNGGHRWLAAITSLGIGASNLVLFKVLPGPTDALQIAAYLLGGPLGIVSSMAAHPHLLRMLRKPAPPAPAAAHTSAPLHALVRDLIDPDGLGYQATPEIRARASRALKGQP